MIKDKETYFKLKELVKNTTVDELLELKLEIFNVGGIAHITVTEDEIESFRDETEIDLDTAIEQAKQLKKAFSNYQRIFRDAKNRIDSTIFTLRELKMYEADFEGDK